METSKLLSELNIGDVIVPFAIDGIIRWTGFVRDTDGHDAWMSDERDVFPSIMVVDGIRRESDSVGEKFTVWAELVTLGEPISEYERIIYRHKYTAVFAGDVSFQVESNIDDY